MKPVVKIRFIHSIFTAVVIAGSVIVGGGSAFATDTAGNFAVKGFGLRMCSDFIDARKNKAPAYLAFRSWTNGYLSAYNQLTPKTYDIAGKTGLENWMAWIGRFCANRADTPFVLAVTSMTAALTSQRTEVKQGGDNSAVMAHSAKTIREIQQALKEKGYYDGGIDGDFGPGTRAALTAYQKAQGLSQTGQPDVSTLTSLLKAKE